MLLIVASHYQLRQYDAVFFFCCSFSVFRGRLAVLGNNHKNAANDETDLSKINSFLDSHVLFVRMTHSTSNINKKEKKVNCCVNYIWKAKRISNNIRNGPIFESHLKKTKTKNKIK